jgi:uncharacterized membrane protein
MALMQRPLIHVNSALGKLALLASLTATAFSLAFNIKYKRTLKVAAKKHQTEVKTS